MVTEVWDHARNPPHDIMGQAVTRMACLERLGMTVLHVPWPVWCSLQSFEDKKQWMRARLREVGWDHGN